MSEGIVEKKLFSDIDINDQFFSSLKDSYKNFVSWFAKKSSEYAYVSYNRNNTVQGFLYMKEERGPVKDINPHIDIDSCLKIGTFKIDAHGTKMGEKFIKIIMDKAVENNIRIIYVTIFPVHRSLIRLLKHFGFFKYGIKQSEDGIEDVYVKNMNILTGVRAYDYPVVNAKNHKKWIVSIHPEFHTTLFPDSILNNESESILEDASYSNSIYKVYIGRFKFERCSVGDPVIIYRTKDDKGPALYRSVITSLCVIDDIKLVSSFSSFYDFNRYCSKYSVFDKEKLKEYYNSSDHFYAVKMTYNIAFPKRTIRKELIEKNIISSKGPIWLIELNDESFNRALQLGEVHEGFVVN